MTERRITMQFTFFIMLTIAFWGIAPIFAKLGLVKVDPLVGLSIRTFTVAAVLFAICLFTGRFGSMTQVSFKDALLISAEGIFASLLGHFAYYYSLKLGDVSKVSPILASYPAVTVIAAMLLLGEKFTWNKVIGLVVIIVGIIIIKR